MPQEPEEVALNPDGLSHFALGREVGSGTTGTVYYASLRRAYKGVKAGESVAVKFLHQRLLDDPAARKRFLREARAGMNVKNRNLVRVFAVEEAELLGSRVLYLVMEWVEGQTLRDLVKEGPAAEPLVRSIGAQVARGLAALHATGAVHLDVKPENVVLAPGGRAVVMDLGFARSLEPATESEAAELRAFTGSVAYAAPERIRHQAPVPESDLYALGIVIYELATGERPFPGDDVPAILRAHLEVPPPAPSSRNGRISPFLDAVVAKCLEKNPTHRFRSALDLATVLERAEGSPFWRERLAERAATATPVGLKRARLTPFHGRDEEQRTLTAELARTAAGAFRMLSLSGEAGVGKTRLVDEFVVKATESEDPPLALYGRCPRVGEPAPAEPFIAMLERYLGLPRGREADAASARRLRALVPSSTATVLLDFLRAPIAAAPVQSFARAFATFLEAASAEQPVVAFLDDADQADPATLETLHAALEAAPPRCLLITAHRLDSTRLEPVFQHARNRGAFVAIPLGPLAGNAMGAIVDEIIEPGPQRPVLRDSLLRTTAGNPGHLAEAVRTLRSSGALVPAAGDASLRMRVAGDITTIPIPESATAAIHQRMQSLEAEERRLLMFVAIEGDRCDVDLLASAFGGDRMSWLRLLGRLETVHGFLSSSAGQFRFARPLVREAVYAAIDEADRLKAHGMLARTLAAGLGPKSTERERLRVAEHARRSEDATLALQVLPGLAEDFRRRGLFERALVLSRSAVDLLNRLPRLEKKNLELRFDSLATGAECYSRLGKRADERRSLEKMARIARYLEDEMRLGRTLLSLGRFSHATGRYLVAAQYLERAIELASRSGDVRTEADAALAKAVVVSYAGDVDAAGSLIERALASTRDGDVRARALLQKGLHLINLDRPDLALEQIDSAHLSFKELRMPAAQASAHFHRARAYAELGLSAQARKDLDRALALARESGERRTEATALSLRGALRASQRDFDGADRDLRASLALASEIGDRFTECHTALHLANSLLSSSNPRRNLREALRLARLGLSIADELELSRLRALAHAVRARAHLRGSKLDDALAESERALAALAEGPRDRRREVAVLFTHAQVLREAGRIEEAREFVNQASSLLRERAERIPNEKLRRSFLEEEPFHSKVLALAESLRVQAS